MSGTVAAADARRSGEGANRKAYVLVCTGAFAVVDGRWRAFGRDAFITRDAADAAVAGFLDRCKAAEGELLGPDPGTLSVRVVQLDLVDDPDAPDGTVFMISAEGRDTTFGGRLSFLCGTLHASRARAEAEMPAFLDRCCDPTLGARHSAREDLVGRIGALTLRELPEETPSLPRNGS